MSDDNTAGSISSGAPLEPSFEASLKPPSRAPLEPSSEASLKPPSGAPLESPSVAPLELGDVPEELSNAGYRRPSEEEFKADGYKADYTAYFIDYERSLLEDFQSGNITFSSGKVSVIHEEPEPPKLSEPEPVKPRRPSFTYPGYYEPE